MTQTQVFISYSSHNRDVAQKVYKVLTKAGILVWLDCKNLQAGETWRREIHKALNTCSHMIYLHSIDAFESDNVIQEWDYFLYLKKPVIPVILDSSPIPYAFISIHHVNLLTQPFDMAMKALIKAIHPYQPSPTDPSERLAIRYKGDGEPLHLPDVEINHATTNHMFISYAHVNKPLNSYKQIDKRFELNIKLSDTDNITQSEDTHTEPSINYLDYKDKLMSPTHTTKRLSNIHLGSFWFDKWHTSPSNPSSDCKQDINPQTLMAPIDVAEIIVECAFQEQITKHPQDNECDVETFEIVGTEI